MASLITDTGPINLYAAWAIVHTQINWYGIEDFLLIRQETLFNPGNLEPHYAFTQFWTTRMLLITKHIGNCPRNSRCTTKNYIARTIRFTPLCQRKEQCTILINMRLQGKINIYKIWGRICKFHWNRDVKLFLQLLLYPSGVFSENLS